MELFCDEVSCDEVNVRRSVLRRNDCDEVIATKCTSASRAILNHCLICNFSWRTLLVKRSVIVNGKWVRWQIWSSVEVFFCSSRYWRSMWIFVILFSVRLSIFRWVLFFMFCNCNWNLNLIEDDKTNTYEITADEKNFSSSFIMGKEENVHCKK